LSPGIGFAIDDTSWRLYRHKAERCYLEQKVRLEFIHANLD